MLSIKKFQSSYIKPIHATSLLRVKVDSIYDWIDATGKHCRQIEQVLVSSRLDSDILYNNRLEEFSETAKSVYWQARSKHV